MPVDRSYAHVPRAAPGALAAAALLALAAAPTPPGSGAEAPAGSVAPAATASGVAAAHPTFLIHDALIVDGTGGPAFRGSVRVHGDRVSSLGDLSPRPGERVVQAGGRILAPGFIEIREPPDPPRGAEAAAALGRGVTTVVVGAGGRHRHPLAPWLDSLREARPALNVASFAGLRTLRERAPAPGEGAARRAVLELLRLEMEAGALGLSTGTETSLDPVDGVALARVVATGRGTLLLGRPAEEPARSAATRLASELREQTGVASRVWPPPEEGRPATVERAVHLLSGRPALELGIRGSSGGPRPGRGVIEALAYADLVLLDPAGFGSAAAGDAAAGPGGLVDRDAAGIVRVWVSGREAWADGAPTGVRAGRVIRWPRM